MSHYENNDPLANLAALALLVAVGLVPYLFPRFTMLVLEAWAWLLVVAAVLTVAWGFVYSVIINIRLLWKKPEPIEQLMENFLRRKP